MSKSLRQVVKNAVQFAGYDVTKITAISNLDLTRLAGSDCLIVGPFLGEFGWELMQWQGYVRQLAKFYEKTVVFGRASSGYFYQDFASEYNVVDCNSWDTDAYELHDFNYDEWEHQFNGSDLLVADNRCLQLRSNFDQAFIAFGAERQANAYDVVLHARSIPVLAGNVGKHLRNWNQDRWDNLCQKLDGLRIAAVGIPELSYCPEDVLDLRGIETEHLCSVLASSRLCVGPSSGLMHLATLCRTPQLIWTSEEYAVGFGGSAYRYVRSWNPFATPVRVLTEMGVDPSVDYIEGELKAFLGELQPKE